jgi:ABC-type lipoprotein export system ATPase subunit
MTEVAPRHPHGQTRMREALLEARALGQTYGHGTHAVVALASATCTVSPGDRIAIMGPSGGGKSTLLHILAGLEIPTSGDISWPALGTRATLRPSKVGLVFQMPSLLPALSVVENVELPLLLGDLAPHLARAAAYEALARLGLASIADKLPEELSGGQIQRVAVARALAPRPVLILADEPTGQLDRPTGQHLFDALLSALQDTPAALIVATHDAALAARMDTLWRMHHGVLEAPVP